VKGGQKPQLVRRPTSFASDARRRSRTTWIEQDRLRPHGRTASERKGNMPRYDKLGRAVDMRRAVDGGLTEVVAYLDELIAQLRAENAAETRWAIPRDYDAVVAFEVALTKGDLALISSLVQQCEAEVAHGDSAAVRKGVLAGAGLHHPTDRDEAVRALRHIVTSGREAAVA
jgi:hypothetical protein